MLIHFIIPRFLVAVLQIDRICVARTVKKIKSALTSMPSELNDLYRETVERIRRQSGDDGELGMRILGWVTHTKRPLHVIELVHGLAVEYDDDEGAHELDIDNLLSSKSLVDVCAGLVVIDSRSQIIRLVHYTTQEYFDKERLQLFNNAEVEISRASLTYLSYDIANSAPSDEVISAAILSHPFLKYASLFWFLHVKEIDGTAQSHAVKQKSLEYVNDSLKIMFTAVVLRKILLRPRAYARVFEDIHRKRRGNHIALEAASECGLIHLVEFLLDHSLGSESALDGAVNWASAEGHTEVVTLLLERGASAQSLTEDSSNSLRKACKVGHLGVAKILLQYGANANTCDRWMWTPLHHAARGGHYGLMALLLAHDASPNSQTPLGLTACHLAASWGDAKSVALLLESTYDLGLTTRDRSTPLHKAAEWRNLKVCRLLLQEGLNVQAKNAYGQTALDLIKDRASPEVMGIFEPYIYAARGTEKPPPTVLTQLPAALPEVSSTQDPAIGQETTDFGRVDQQREHQLELEESILSRIEYWPDKISKISVGEEVTSAKQNSGHEDYGAFFTPPELLNKSNDHAKIVNTNLDNDINLDQASKNNIVDPERIQDSYTASELPIILFGEINDKVDSSRGSLTWQAPPSLRLVTPTPPSSRASTPIQDAGDGDFEERITAAISRTISMSGRNAARSQSN